MAGHVELVVLFLLVTVAALSFVEVVRRALSDPAHGRRQPGNGLAANVKPLMQAAGVLDELAHPHVLRHTFGTLWLARDGNSPTCKPSWATPPQPPPRRTSTTPPATSSEPSPPRSAGPASSHRCEVEPAEHSDRTRDGKRTFESEWGEVRLIGPAIVEQNARHILSTLDGLALNAQQAAERDEEADRDKARTMLDVFARTGHST